MATQALEKEIGHGNTGLIPWSAFGDVGETVPELAFPQSVTTYSRMRIDAQIASLLLPLPSRSHPPLSLAHRPQRRPSEVVEDVASNLNLPIERQDDAPVGRRRDRFSHDRHLFHALLNLVYGFSMFEQVYRYNEGTVSRSREVRRVSGTHTVQPDHRRQPVTTPLPITRAMSST
jgi:hypothetical protein